jgi:hypothetical protein
LSLYLAPTGGLRLLSDKHGTILTYFQTKVNKKSGKKIAFFEPL